MTDLETVLTAFQKAKDSAVASLIREGVPLEQANEEATLYYISFPEFRELSNDDFIAFTKFFENDLVNEEFLRLIKIINLGTIKIWDVNFSPNKLTKIGRVKDLYLSNVIEQTLCRKEFLPKTGLVIGFTDNSDLIVLSYEPDSLGNHISLFDHEKYRFIASISVSLLDFLLANALLAAKYFDLIETNKIHENWIDDILSTIPSNLASYDWLYISLSSRIRPF